MTPDRIYIEYYLKRFTYQALVAYRYTKDFAEAEDIVQSVIVRSTKESFESVAHLAVWVKEGVKFQCLNYLVQRARKKRKTAESIMLLETTEEQQTEIFRHGIRHNVLLSLVNTLAPAQKLIIKLLYIDGHTMPEIANMTGRSVSTIKNIKNQAIGNLRRLLKTSKEEYEENNRRLFQKIKQSPLSIGQLSKLYNINHCTIRDIKEGKTKSLHF